MNEKPLKAPPNDILKIGERLKRMNFKTLICKDLTKTSMENVLDFFITLLIDGVYGEISIILSSHRLNIKPSR